MISGGAVTEYTRQTNRAKADYEAVDSFKKKWSGSALDVVIEFLVSFYSVQTNANKTHSLLSENLVAIGSAFIKSKKHSSLF